MIRYEPDSHVHSVRCACCRLPLLSRVSLKGWDRVSNMDDSLATFLLSPTSSTVTSEQPRTELAQSAHPPLVPGKDAACPADYTADNGWWPHRAVEVPQQSFYSKWPWPPEQEESALALLVQGVCVATPVQFNQRTWSSQCSQPSPGGPWRPTPPWCQARGGKLQRVPGRAHQWAQVDEDQSLQNWPTLTHKPMKQKTKNDDIYTFFPFCLFTITLMTHYMLHNE